ncbi:hypothetical protein PGT21_014218 [Puccinia graminis f. sp. tritici]|uniref:Uncharacterized protein n=1 Tax=Puccinia graminis f. sp. tritici TaxID=56615 RepID=A0A5B0RXS7_PUCGR|nr:hypothetical protein PGT21_014218 [Puccinia graminis f. sp. tritici]KAA1129314.1 hypothetical protein PGTUg99_026527 [Puccinia graminis f. sp. tritici]
MDWIKNKKMSAKSNHLRGDLKIGEHSGHESMAFPRSVNETTRLFIEEGPVFYVLETAVPNYQSEAKQGLVRSAMVVICTLIESSHA